MTSHDPSLSLSPCSRGRVWVVKGLVVLGRAPTPTLPPDRDWDSLFLTPSSGPTPQRSLVGEPSLCPMSLCAFDLEGNHFLWSRCLNWVLFSFTCSCHPIVLCSHHGSSFFQLEPPQACVIHQIIFHNMHTPETNNFVGDYCKHSSSTVLSMMSLWCNHSVWLLIFIGYCESSVSSAPQSGIRWMGQLHSYNLNNVSGYKQHFL